MAAPRLEQSRRVPDPVVHEVELPAGENVDVRALGLELRKVFTSPAYRPPQLPAVALELSALARRPEVDAAEVSRVLERDPLLSSRVLSVANSALYARGTPILSLRNAVSRLGLRALRDLVLEAALHCRIFRAEAYAAAMAQLGRHASATAHLSRLVCRYTSLDAEHAFACGLLHDVGVAAALLVLAERKAEERPAAEVSHPVIAVAHPELGGIVLQSWQVAAEIGLVVGAHHRREVAGRIHPLVAAVALAEHLADELGFGAPPGLDGVPPLLAEQCAQVLGLTEKQLELVRRDSSQVGGVVGGAQ
ncbi:MAG TPA: HDOD domain-containing protein [Myxococcaceae bacterium]|nr:HDOD domain-containing protein [Myxococcaceae bacterium]